MNNGRAGDEEFVFGIELREELVGEELLDLLVVAVEGNVADDGPFRNVLLRADGEYTFEDFFFSKLDVWRRSVVARRPQNHLNSRVVDTLAEF